MDRVLRRSSRNNQSKLKETNSSNEELINKRKQPLGDFEVDINGSNPGNSSTAKRIEKQDKSTSSRYSLDEDLIVQIMQVLGEHNPLVKTFWMARERFKDDPDMQLKIKLIGRRTKFARNYNLPTVDEVAALIVGDINVSSFDERDILIESHVEGLKRISELHPEYLALQYPLLFIYAEDGYRADILHRDVDVYEHTTWKKKRVTMREFFAYKLQERAVPTLVHLGRKLYQQFVVDAYTMIEAERISYIRKNQNILRADTFTNIMNASLSGNAVNSMMGNMIKLPFSFTGSARYMIENYRDAMALCRVFGYPDLFLTFTCNPKCPEITRELDGTGFKPEDKYALCARMFKMKLDQLMKDIRKKKIFGTLKAEVYTVEFQKRGLPHAHICLFLDERSKMPQLEDVDKYICAEIPDEINKPELYQLVSDLMIHGPCGDKNPSCQCTDTETKKCTKRFPKPFSDVTKTDQDGYPIYRIRNDGRTVRKQGHDLDNSCVVPYNPQLLKMYQAHLNVEWCNQIGSIRYLFKYINKAMWRIFSFDIHHHRPSVIRLLFHFEGEHQIIFDEDEVIEQVLEKPSVNTSMFLEWMKCNGCNQQARQLTYVDFPTKFIWDKDNRVWKLRKRKTGAIGRIHHVSPAAGPTSYEEIRTVNGILFDNFKDACYHLGLLDDDNEYTEAIKEAFFGEGTKIGIELLKDLTLQEIERLLQRNSSSLRNFSSMPFTYYNTRNISENHLIIDELSYDKSTLEVEHADFITKLTTEQKDAYDRIIKAVDEGTGAVFFLYSYGGTGKTFLWKTLTAALRSKGEIVLNVATSGIAALLLSGGRTAHSRFRIPLQPTDESFCTIKSDSNLAELIRRAKLIIWDEAPMVNKMCVEALDWSFRDICRQINPHSIAWILYLGVKLLCLVVIFDKFYRSFKRVQDKI
ncbi:uncharacterized protein [Rutidosis leptorrhynchoides]|uniref:uncharacterized protein n=1 Tax=Rutidosis leptorrhynchoides TaxID=125765 RepID=UPI003A9968CE